MEWEELEEEEKFGRGRMKVIITRNLERMGELISYNLCIHASSKERI